MRKRQIYRCPVCKKNLTRLDYCYSVDGNDLCSEECARTLSDTLRAFDRFRNGKTFALDFYTDYRTLS